ncbi:hypothetical protein OCK74_14995 [Chitinophagaceae bacterium LB-8]|uniref:Uncharacterized protein n=1 Tax=Paraflavisolibacter caeni TaxID=2982496 RepID=A0A9X2XX88_9BACT|nr:hypothetical protein [Paraflavisolibacter caeni]MCU7550426.1 hypothetical protein [Paraflavisolibacter caeni]
MAEKQEYKLGILAYGSLVDDPGPELKPLIVDRIPCQTPFNVEYARLSAGRSDAPTVIPVAGEGKPVKAFILVLADNITQLQAESMLWRREIRTSDLLRTYRRPEEPHINSVLVESISNFQEVETVLYTSIKSNMGILNTPPYLAHFAIESILNEAGEKKMDGLRYLKNNIDNGILTPLTSEYRAEILKQTAAKDLDEAIEKLDKLRPANLARLADIKEFEKKVIEIADFVCEYGIKSSIENSITAQEKIQEAIKGNHEKFIANCHTGFKKGQKLALRLIEDIQEKVSTLKKELKLAHKSRNRNRIAQIKSDIELYCYKENVIRHTMDYIAWQMIHGQLYISRRLYKGVEGDKILKYSNIKSVEAVADKINERELDFALITDITSYVQIGDLLCTIDNQVVLGEVKEGKRNLEILEVLGEVNEGEATMDEMQIKYSLTKKDMEQLLRQMKQEAELKNVTDIINTDKGIDSSTGQEIKIITPKEGTPRFIKELYELRKQLDTRNLWAYNVIENCLHIGIFKGHFKFVGKALLKGIAEQGTKNYFIVDFLKVIESLNKPIFTLPVEKEFIFDILFKRVKVLFMIDLDEYIKLADKVGLIAEWATERETNKTKALTKHKNLFVFNGQGIKVYKKGVDKDYAGHWIAPGTFHKMFFEHIYPSYTLYSLNYFIEMEGETHQSE